MLPSTTARHLLNSDSMLHAPCSLLRERCLICDHPASLVTRHTSLVTGRRPAAFTLIELLVVIAIIAILAGLAFPAVQGALNSSKKAQARNDVAQLAAAVKAFQLEYGRLPNTIANGDTTPTAKDVVSALTSSNSPLNPRGIAFIEANAYRKGKGGTNSSGA